MAGIFINLLIIIIALIVLLSLYLISTRKENAMDRERLKANRFEFEAGEELNITEEDLEFAGDREEELDDFQDQGDIELDYRYNKTLIRLLTVDPNHLYTYWEITDHEYYQNYPCLRVFGESDNSFYDIDISHQANEWYITGVKANNNYKVAVGYKKDGKFKPLCYSNSVQTPADRPSDLIDEKWMTIEELSEYSYRIDINSTLSLLKSLKKRREREKINVGSFSFTSKDNH